MSNLTREQNIEILGKTGEKIVSNFFSKSGKIVEQAINNFDSTKDMVVDGKKIEVKTQVPFVLKSSFTFRKNQLRKCLNADQVVFVSIPNGTMKHYSDGKVYSIDSKKLKYDLYTTKDGREMVLINIGQPDMIELYKMSDEECKELMKYTTSSWK
jgi:hypothetical protein